MARSVKKSENDTVVVETEAPRSSTPKGQEIEAYQGTGTSPLDLPVSVFQAALERRKANRAMLMDWIRGALSEGVDYGRIHTFSKARCRMAAEGKSQDCTNPRHWSKPSLFKPGAEKICGMLGITVHFPTLNDYEKAVLTGVDVQTVILRCELQDGIGRTVADGVGARTIAQDQGDLNKAMKMAVKSAHIDATLRMAGLSEVFTQDLEDMNLGASQDGKTDAARNAATDAPADDAGAHPIGTNSAKHKELEARILELGLDKARVQAWCEKKWGLAELGELSHEQYLALKDRLLVFARQAWDEIKDKPISADKVQEVQAFVDHHELAPTALLEWAGVESLADLRYEQLDTVWNHLEGLAREKAQTGYIEQPERARAAEAYWTKREASAGRSATGGT